MTRPLQAVTIIATPQLPLARALARSFYANNPDGRFCAFMLTNRRRYFAPEAEPFELLSPDDLHIAGWKMMARRYATRELAAVVRPAVMQHLLRRRDCEATVYFDPHTYIYTSLGELSNLAQQAKLVVSSPPDDLLAVTPDLGYAALGRGVGVEDVPELLEPGRVSHAALMLDAGYGVAYWNVTTRDLTRAAEGYEIDGAPLRFFHFVGYDPADPESLGPPSNRIDLSRRTVLKELCDDYGLALVEAGYEECRAWPYPSASDARAKIGKVFAIAEQACGQTTPAGGRNIRSRVLDLANLMTGLKLSGAGPLAIIREVKAALAPLRR